MQKKNNYRALHYVQYFCKLLRICFRFKKIHFSKSKVSNFIETMKLIPFNICLSIKHFIYFYFLNTNYFFRNLMISFAFSLSNSVDPSVDLFCHSKLIVPSSIHDSIYSSPQKLQIKTSENHRAMLKFI